MGFLLAIKLPSWRWKPSLLKDVGIKACRCLNWGGLLSVSLEAGWAPVTLTWRALGRMWFIFLMNMLGKWCSGGHALTRTHTHSHLCCTQRTPPCSCSRVVLSPFDTSCDARVDSLESFWVNEAIAGYRLAHEAWLLLCLGDRHQSPQAQGGSQARQWPGPRRYKSPGRFFHWFKCVAENRNWCKDAGVAYEREWCLSISKNSLQTFSCRGWFRQPWTNSWLLLKPSLS